MSLFSHRGVIEFYDNGDIHKWRCPKCQKWRDVDESCCGKTLEEFLNEFSS